MIIKTIDPRVKTLKKKIKCSRLLLLSLGRETRKFCMEDFEKRNNLLVIFKISMVV